MLFGKAITLLFNSESNEVIQNDVGTDDEDIDDEVIENIIKIKIKKKYYYVSDNKILRGLKLE